MLSKQVEQRLIDIVNDLNSKTPIDITLQGTQIISITLSHSNYLRESELRQYLTLTYVDAPTQYNAVYIITLYLKDVNSNTFTTNFLYFVCNPCNTIHLVNDKGVYEMGLNDIGLKLRQYSTMNISEMSSTGNVAGYNTPNAFAKNKKQHRNLSRKKAKLTGYTLVDDLNESSKYEITPRQEMKNKLLEVNRTILELQYLIKDAINIKNKINVTNIPKTFKTILKRITTRIDYIKQELKHFEI